MTVMIQYVIDGSALCQNLPIPRYPSLPISLLWNQGGDFLYILFREVIHWIVIFLEYFEVIMLCKNCQFYSLINVVYY